MTPVRWVAAALSTYAIGFVLFWPRLLLIVDEERYVSQAVAFAHGARTLAGSGILYPALPVDVISNYPPGTSLLQAPLVWLGGWRMAAVLSVLALVAATLLTMRWLRAHGAHPGFALLLPGFVGASFFGRVAMSDVPATALVALAGWLIWRAENRSAGSSLLAGFAAALVLLFREPVFVLLLPLLAGAVVRRRCAPLPLVAGLALGVALKLGVGALLFGSPWYLRDPGVSFSLASLAHTLPLFAVILLVLVPGGALLPVVHRGPRHVELRVAVAAYVGLFLLYDYDAVALNGPVKGLLLAARFMAPAMPLLCLMAADVWPRWYSALRARVPAATALVPAAGAAVVGIAFLVHPAAARQERATLPILGALQAATRADAPVVTNTDATLKYLSPAYGPRQLVVMDALPVDSLAAFTNRHGTLTLAVLDRFDSRVFAGAATAHDQFLAAARSRCETGAMLDTAAAGMRLRVMDVSACR